MKKNVVLLALSLLFFTAKAQSTQDLKYVIAKSAMYYIQHTYKNLESFENFYVQCKLLYLCDNHDNKSLVPLLVEEAPILVHGGRFPDNVVSKIRSASSGTQMEISDIKVQSIAGARTLKTILIRIK